MSSDTPFSPRGTATIGALIEAFPLAWVVSCGAAGRGASVLPLLPEYDQHGNVIALLGHFARSNPQVAVIEQQPEAMILAQGPQGYISPRLVSNPRWGPTWNYAIVRFDVDIAFVPDENHTALERLAAALEGTGPGAWTVERMGPRYDELARHIIAFRATVKNTDARFKLGQDETPGTFDEIVAGLENRVLADWMERATGD